MKPFFLQEKTFYRLKIWPETILDGKYVSGMT